MIKAVDAVLEIVSQLPIVDAHTHLLEDRPAARGLDDIVLYHMAVSELYAAGAPHARRLTEFPGVPDEQERTDRLAAAVPFMQHVKNTSTSWGVRIILRDLYGWNEEVTESNWRRLHGLITERSADPAWPGEVLKRAGIVHAATEYARRGQVHNPMFFYTLEWGFFTRCAWGAFDTPLVELERCVGSEPGVSAPIAAADESSEKPPQLTSISAIQDAIREYVGALPPKGVIRSTATHVSVDLDLRPVTDSQLTEALSRRDRASQEEQSIYASYVNEMLLSEMAELRPDLIFQFSYGAEPLPYETGSRTSDRSLRQIGEMIARHPKVNFQCFLASRYANQPLCTMSRELPNFSLAGYWWHNFFPAITSDVMDERLDMLPTNRFVGFFSDAYCVEWSYAKAVIVRRLLAEALAKRVERSQLDPHVAKDIASRILYDTPYQMYHLNEPTVTQEIHP